MIPFIQAAATAALDAYGNHIPLSNRLVVVPGLELTLGVPCQALLILDADMPIDRLPLVLEALAVDATHSSAARLPGVTRIDHIDVWARPSRSSGWRLPKRGEEYYADSGLDPS